jgi:hypothetical protein
VGDGDGVIEVGFVAGFLQAVGVALGVAEAQRVDDRLGQFDAGVGVLVERPVQALGRTGAQVVAAMGADLAVGRQVAMEDHLLAGGALVPQIVRHGGPREQSADFRSDVFGEPAHFGWIAGAWGGGKIDHIGFMCLGGGGVVFHAGILSWRA